MEDKRRCGCEICSTESDLPVLETYQTNLINRTYWQKHVERASAFYEDKMGELDKSFEEMRGWVPGVDKRVELPNHLMYRLDCLNAPTEEDGQIHRQYEFLIEYHRKKPNEGIYYGCRGITKHGFDHTEAIKKFQNDWDNIEPFLCTVLNNTFPDKDFTQRFKMTDNANDNTYWLFWITLYEDEDINEVAVRATKIIRSVFEAYVMCGADFIKKDKPRSKKTNDRVAFTNSTYEDLIAKIELKTPGKIYNQHATEKCKEIFLKFLKRAENVGWLTQDRFYEMAYRFTHEKKSDTDFAHMIVSSLNYARDEAGKYFGESLNLISVPWEQIRKVFLSQGGNTFGNIKTLYANDGSKDEKERYWYEKITKMMK